MPVSSATHQGTRHTEAHRSRPGRSWGQPMVTPRATGSRMAAAAKMTGTTQRKVKPGRTLTGKARLSPWAAQSALETARLICTNRVFNITARIRRPACRCHRHQPTTANTSAPSAATHPNHTSVYCVPCFLGCVNPPQNATLPFHGSGTSCWSYRGAYGPGW